VSWGQRRASGSALRGGRPLMAEAGPSQATGRAGHRWFLKGLSAPRGRAMGEGGPHVTATGEGTKLIPSSVN
jgi:hypothetical protein